MATVYRPIDAGWITDARIRALVDEINRCLRDWGAQFNTAISQASDSPATSGVVSSIQANATAKRSGPLTFANTSTITVASVGATPPNNHIFTWAVDTAAIAAALGAIPAITYGSSFVQGSAGTFIRTDATLVYPEALGAAADRTDKLTLTDDAGAGALLTASNTYSVDTLAVKAPNATAYASFGKYGNITLNSGPNSEYYMLNFSKTDFNEAATGPVGVNFTLTNVNIGDSVAILRGFSAVITGSCSSAAASTTRTVEGGRIALSAGNAANNNFLGSMFGLRIISTNLNTQTAATAIPLVCCYESSNTNVVTRAALTDLMHFRARGAATLLSSGTITNHTGFRCEAITAGTNRYGVDIAAITTGTPTLSYGVNIGAHSVGTTRIGVKVGAITGGTVAAGLDVDAFTGGTDVYGVRIGAHSGGTNRYGVNIGAFTGGTIATGVEVAAFSGGTTMRSFRGGNTLECTANDFFCSTAAKGLITKDTQGTPRYWRMYNSSSGTASVGTTLGQTVDGYVYMLRGGSPGGEVQLKIDDASTTAPAS